MYTLRELAELYLTESLLAGYDDSMRQSREYNNDRRLQGWSEKSRGKASWKNGKDGYVLTGDYRIENIESYASPLIKKVKGSLAIVNTKLTSLKGMFADGAVIEGTLTIEDNPNLTSLDGCPAQVNTLIIAGNKQLKSLDGCPVVMNNLYVSRNGKKFDKETLQDSLTVNKNIYCSVESDEEIISESMVCESFKSIHLKLLWDRIKELNTYKSKIVASQFIGGDFCWDKVENSNAHEYERGPEATKAARAVITGKHRGLIILYNDKGQINKIIRGHKLVDLTDGTVTSFGAWSSEKKTTELVDVHVARASTVVIVDLTNVQPTWDIKTERNRARFGATALTKGDERKSSMVTARDVRYYQEIADENRQRYKKLLNKIRAERASVNNNYDSLKGRIEKCFERYTKLMVNVFKNPLKYNHYDIGYLNDAFTGELGIFRALEHYIDLLHDASKGMYNTHLNRFKTMDAAVAGIEAEINDACFRIEEKLKKLESV